jgi:hypothetical protein
MATLTTSNVATAKATLCRPFRQPPKEAAANKSKKGKIKGRQRKEEDE